MTEPAHPTEKPLLAIKFGRASLTGPKAIIALGLLVVLIVVVIVLVRPSPRMLVSGVIWVAFTNYWSYQAARAAPAKQAESKHSRRFHQLLLNGSILLLFVPIPGLRERFLPLNNVVIAVGFGVLIGTAMLGVWARRHLGRNWSGAISAAAGHQLIRSGPYRTVRHPIYTAIIGMFVGTAIISGEMHALLGVLIVTVAYWRKIRLEEAHLRNIFGADYDAYTKGTSALIPSIL